MMLGLWDQRIAQLLIPVFRMWFDSQGILRSISITKHADISEWFYFTKNLKPCLLSFN